jgi:phytoene dehydrogenase-like protein
MHDLIVVGAGLAGLALAVVANADMNLMARAGAGNVKRRCLRSSPSSSVFSCSAVDQPAVTRMSS